MMDEAELSVVESDGVCETFLPSDYKDIIGRAVDPTASPRLLFTFKKQLYLWLPDNSIIIDNGTNVKKFVINNMLYS
ncbi:hypothetical protein ACSBR2_042996 [Camellia fascicularis]